VFHIAAVHSPDARVALGLGTFAFFGGGAAQVRGRLAPSKLLDEVVPGRAIDVGERVGILFNRCRNKRNATGRWLS
jgi:hypothetical protein